MKNVQAALFVLAFAVLVRLPAVAGEAASEADLSKAIDAMLPDMGSPEVGKQSKPQQELQKMAYNASRPGAEAERVALAKAMASKLSGDATTTAKVWILRQLEAMGRAEVVDAVAACLKDKEPLIRETARRCLQNNPAPEATKVLLSALDGADAQWREAVINALGFRKDPASLSTLLKDAAADDDKVRSAAVCALALIGDKSAADAIAAGMNKGSDAAKRAATDSYLLLADKLAEKGEKDAALAIAKKMLASQGHVKCAAIVALGRAGGAAEVNTILEVMNDPDPKVRGAGIEALNVMTSPEATKAIAEKVKTANPDLKVTLLRALMSRADKSTLPTFVACAADADESVKTEAVKGLAVLGDASVIPLLVKIASETGKPQEAARNSLDRLAGGADIDGSLITALGTADAKGKAELARSLGARRAESAVPALLKAAEDADGAVRQEAWKALGVVADAKTLPQLVALLVKAQDADREEAGRTVIAACKRDQDVEKRAEPILAGFGGAQGPPRLALLGVLGRVGGKKPLEALRAALKEKDDKVHDATVRAIAEWPDAAVADDLLAIAKGQETEAHQVIALRGFVRVVTLPGAGGDTVKLLASAMEACKRNDEKKMVLGGLGEVKSGESLDMVAKYLDDDALKNEAQQAAVKIAKDIHQRAPESVKAAMDKIIATSKNTGLKNEAKKALAEAEKKLASKKPK